MNIIIENLNVKKYIYIKALNSNNKDVGRVYENGSIIQKRKQFCIKDRKK